MPDHDRTVIATIGRTVSRNPRRAHRTRALPGGPSMPADNKVTKMDVNDIPGVVSSPRSPQEAR